MQFIYNETNNTFCILSQFVALEGGKYLRWIVTPITAHMEFLANSNFPVESTRARKLILPKNILTAEECLNHPTINKQERDVVSFLRAEVNRRD